MNYKEFGKEYIGDSDVASLVLVGVTKKGLSAEILNFGEDRSYSAYMADGDNVEIGSVK